MSQVPTQQAQPAAAVDVRALFSGIKNAKGRMKANYMREGHYWLNIKRCKVDKSRKQETFAPSRCRSSAFSTARAVEVTDSARKSPTCSWRSTTPSSATSRA